MVDTDRDAINDRIKDLEARIDSLRKARDDEYARTCPKCGLRTVTIRQESYYDVDRCANCTYSDIVYALLD